MNSQFKEEFKDLFSDEEEQPKIEQKEQQKQQIQPEEKIKPEEKIQPESRRINEKRDTEIIDEKMDKGISNASRP